MKGALVLLSVVLLVLGGLALLRGVFMEGLKASMHTSLRLLPMLALAFLLAGLAEALLPKGFVERWLSEGAGPRGYFLAWLGGALTPAGGIIGLPLAASLLKAGASVGVLVTYLCSLSLLSLLRLPMEIGIYGLKLAVLRMLACVLLPPLAGIVAQGLVWAFVRQNP